MNTSKGPVRPTTPMVKDKEKTKTLGPTPVVAKPLGATSPPPSGAGATTTSSNRSLGTSSSPERRLPIRQASGVVENVSQAPVLVSSTAGPSVLTSPGEDSQVSFDLDSSNGGDAGASPSSLSQDLINSPNVGSAAGTGAFATQGGGGNVNVCVRFRPQNKVETESGGVWSVEASSSQKSVKVKDPSSFYGASQFNFDRIFMPESPQKDVYEFVGRPLVADLLNGYNCSLMAYGQTGSGKTHTMMGDEGELQGIIPRIINDIFDYMEAAPASSEFSIRVSYVEIYLERVCDLLNPENADLKIRENNAQGLFLEGVEECYVGSRYEIEELMRRGSNNRSVASTRMNADSSRSHSVFIIATEQVDKNVGVKKVGRMFLVDLAGSETVSKTNASGQTLQEAKMINKSLSALGNVIKALVEKQSHVPYRDSKLTRLLQEALGGNSKTSLIIACSGSSYNLTETLSTIRFGVRAKSIKNKPRVNQERSVEEYKRLLEEAATKQKDLESIIRRLESQVQGLLSRGIPSPTPQDQPTGAPHHGDENEKLTSSVSIGELLAGELMSMVSVLQPAALEIRDMLESTNDDIRIKELDSLMNVLSGALTARQSSVISSGILRLFQIFKDVLQEKIRALGTSSTTLKNNEETLAEKNATIAALKAQITELRAANEKSAMQLSEANARSVSQINMANLRVIEEKKKASLAEEQTEKLQSDLMKKDFEIREQGLVINQLRSTLDTIVTSMPTAAVVTSVVSSGTNSSSSSSSAKVTAAGDGKEVDVDPVTKVQQEMEKDLRDLMSRYVQMRAKFEEERSALNQLKDLLDEIESGDGGREAGEAILAGTIIDLRKALDNKGMELQAQGALVQNLLSVKATMEAQMSLRDEHIKHLEIVANDLQGRTKNVMSARDSAESLDAAKLAECLTPTNHFPPPPPVPSAAAISPPQQPPPTTERPPSIRRSLSSAFQHTARLSFGGEASDEQSPNKVLSPSLLGLLGSPGSVEAGLKWMDGMLTGKKPGNNSSGSVKKVIRGKGQGGDA